MLPNIDNLSSGDVIDISLTDREVTDYLNDYLFRHKDDVKKLISQKIKINLDISDVIVNFEENELQVSARLGTKLFKADAKATASVIWDGKAAVVNVKSLELPIIKIDAARANDIIQKPIQDFVEKLKKDFDINSFRIIKGMFIIKARKK